MFLQPGQAFAERFSVATDSVLDLSVKGLSSIFVGHFVEVFTEDEYQKFQQVLELEGDWDGGLPLVSSGSNRYQLSPGQYAIVLGLKAGETPTPEPVNVELRYQIFPATN